MQGFGGYGDIGAMTYSTLTTLGQTIRLLPWPELPPRTYKFTGIETMPLGLSEIVCVGNHRQLFKVNYDASLYLDSNLAKFGCIIRDFKGN